MERNLVKSRPFFASILKPPSSLWRNFVYHQVIKKPLRSSLMLRNQNGKVSRMKSKSRHKLSNYMDQKCRRQIYQNMSSKPSWCGSLCRAVKNEGCWCLQTTKPPSSFSPPKVRPKQAKEADLDEAISDAENLKKDLALQRLLKESHLLDHQSPSSPYGQNRHKAIDLRLQELGTKSSLYHQRNMPMSQRKGIAAKASGREESRRKEAKENGVILERATKGRKDIIDTKRQRGIGAPSVGRFKGGMLTLSKRDVIEIQGRKKTSKGKRWLGLLVGSVAPDMSRMQISWFYRSTFSDTRYLWPVAHSELLAERDVKRRILICQLIVKVAVSTSFTLTDLLLIWSCFRPKPGSSIQRPSVRIATPASENTQDSIG